MKGFHFFGKHRNVCRIARIALVAASSLAFLSCENSGDNGQQKLVKLEMWYVPSQSEAGEPPADWFLYERLRNELGIDLILHALPYDQKEMEMIIMQAAKTNSLPDIFRCSHSTMLELAKQNKITSVDKMFPLMPQRTKGIYTESAKRAAQIDGMTFALAYPSSNTSVPKNEGVLIRKDWLDKLNLPIPKTIDDFYNVMLAFTFNDPDGNHKDDTYGFGAYIEANVQEDGLGKRFSPIFGAFGVCGTFNYDREHFALNIRDEKFFDAMTFVRKMVTSKVIDPNWSAYKKDDFRDAWKSGRFGIMRENFGAYSLKSNYKPFDDNFPDGEWIVIDPPKGADGKSAVGTNTQTWNFLAVNKRTYELGKIPRLAKMLEWMYTDAYMDIWYGQEGVNYNLLESGKISDKVADEKKSYTAVESKNLLQLRWIVDRYSDEQLRERYPLWTKNNGQTMDSLEILKQMQSKPWIDGFSFEKMDDNLQKLYRNGIKDFILGYRNLTKENWDAFVKELDAKGLSEWEEKIKEEAKPKGFMS